LKPDVDAKAEAKKAKHEADGDLKGESNINLYRPVEFV